MAAALTERGVAAGDRVVVMLDNGSAAVCLLLAIWQLNATPVPLRPVAGSGDWFRSYLAEIDRLCDVRLVVTEHPLAVGCGKPIVPVSALQCTTGSPMRHHARTQSLALIQFSSGSTGQPKGVMVTHQMVEEQVRQLVDNYVLAGGDGPPTSIASWLPLYHDMGLFIGLLLPLYLGVDVMVAPPAFYLRNPPRWFRAMADRG